MQEVNFLSVDFGFELREGVELRLEGAPVIMVRPVLAQFLQIGHVRAIGPAVSAILDYGHFMPFILTDLGQNAVDNALGNVDLERNRGCH
mgnify:CR=1 FL=1